MVGHYKDTPRLSILRLLLIFRRGLESARIANLDPKSKTADFTAIFRILDGSTALIPIVDNKSGFWTISNNYIAPPLAVPPLAAKVPPVNESPTIN